MSHSSDIPENFESALKELDHLVLSMESGAMPLSTLLTSYQRGAQLLKYCKEQLQSVENQVHLLEQGEAEPWQP
jgi:exodeoxyribonuclease VII small subunit